MEFLKYLGTVFSLKESFCQEKNWGFLGFFWVGAGFFFLEVSGNTGTEQSASQASSRAGGWDTRQHESHF